MRLSCSKCQTIITTTCESLRDTLPVCPACSAPWKSSAPGRKSQVPVETLVQAMLLRYFMPANKIAED